MTLHHVDLENSYLCGYLKISGLTEEFPTMTTFFDGEIISERYPFLTRKWEADEQVDLDHWKKFSQFSLFSKTFNTDGFDYADLRKSNCVFMRWKVACYTNMPCHVMNGDVGLVARALSVWHAMTFWPNLCGKLDGCSSRQIIVPFLIM